MELLDICDLQGKPTGQVVSREQAHKLGICHRTAHVWVTRTVEDRTQVLLQKRSMDKDSFPGRLDTSSAGHIPAGSEPLSSAVRELQEELGVEVTPEQLCPIGVIRNQYEQEFYGQLFRDNEVTFVYLCTEPVELSEIRIQQEELEAVGWYDLEDTMLRIESGDPDYCVTLSSLELLKTYIEQQ